MTCHIRMCKGYEGYIVWCQTHMRHRHFGHHFNATTMTSLCFPLQTTDPPKVIEVCELQSRIPVREELTVAFVIHVCLHSFRGVEGLPLLVAP